MGESPCPVMNMSLVTLSLESVIAVKSCPRSSQLLQDFVYQQNLWKYAPKVHQIFWIYRSGLMHHDLIKSVEHRKSCCVHLRSMECFYCRRHGREGPWMDKGKQTWMKLRWLQCEMTYIWWNDSHRSYIYIYCAVYIRIQWLIFLLSQLTLMWFG